MILSKLYAMDKSAHRPKDLDDLLSIYETDPKPDLAYLQSQLDELNLRLSPQKKRELPREVKSLF